MFRLKMDKLLPKPDFPVPEIELLRPAKAALSLLSTELLDRMFVSVDFPFPVSSIDMPEAMLLFLLKRDRVIGETFLG